MYIVLYIHCIKNIHIIDRKATNLKACSDKTAS